MVTYKESYDILRSKGKYITFTSGINPTHIRTVHRQNKISELY